MSSGNWRNRFEPRTLLCLLLLPGLLCAASRTAFAWFDETPEGADANGEMTQGLPSDRRTILAVNALRSALSASDWPAAAELLSTLQKAEPHLMVPSTDHPQTFVPLHRAVFDAVHQLPATVRERLAKANAGAANLALAHAAQEGDPSLLPDLILRFAGTDASVEAHFLLAKMHRDRGQVQAAVSWLNPLAMPGIAQPASDTAERLLEDFRVPEPVSAPATDGDNQPQQKQQPPDTLFPATSDWQLTWQYRPMVSEKVRQQITGFLQAAQEANTTPPSTWSDHIDGQTAYRRTLNGMAAIDLTTGEPQWQYALQPELDSILASNRQNTSAFQRAIQGATPDTAYSRLEQTPLAHLFCRDNVTGRVTGDAEHLYLISGGTTLSFPSRVPNFAFRQRSPDADFEGSRLVALEKKTGRRIWTIGRNMLEQQLGKHSSPSWFAGLPTLAGRHLFAVFEWNGEVRVGSFETRTGELLWSVLLAFPEQSIDKDPVRRLWSATPVVSGGLIWSSTTTGWVTCVDSLTRSILWASRVGQPAPDRAAVGMFRGRSVVATPGASLNERWSAPALLKTQHRLICMPHDSRDLIFLDPATGYPARQTTVGLAPLLVHHDDERLVISEQSRLLCRSAVDGRELWNRQLTADDGVPTGNGVADQHSLLLPMTTGAIARFNLSSGSLLETVPEVLPTGGWGHLSSMHSSHPSAAATQAETSSAVNNVLYVAPDRLTRISTSPAENDSRNPAELASALLAAQKWEQALQAASQVSAQDERVAEAKAIAFAARLQLAFRSPEKHLSELKPLAVTEQQRLQVRVLETSVLLSRKEFAPAIEQLLSLLTLPAPQLSLPIPLADSMMGVEAPDSGLRPSRPLLTWATSQLAAALDQLSPLPTSVTEQIEQLDTAVLLTLHHPATLPAIYGRIDTLATTEPALHLLRHAVDIRLAAESKKAAGNDANTPDAGTKPLSFEREIQLFEQLVQKVKARPDTPIRDAAMLLLNLVALEFPAPYSDALRANELFSTGDFQTREALQQDFQSKLQEQFSQWSADSYQAIPVVRSLYGATQTTMTLAENEDLFLKQFRWSAVRGEYGRLQAQSAWQPVGSQWSVPGTFQFSGSYSTQQDLLQRHGSVVVLRTARGLSAISVLEQKVLWARNWSAGVTVTMFGGPAQNFQDFVPGRHHLPSSQSFSVVHLLGGGQRWLGMKVGSEVSVVDLLTGRSLWTAECDNADCHLNAAQSAVVLSSRSKVFSVFDRRDGTRLPTAAITSLDVAPIRNIDHQLVCWKKGSAQTPPSLQWLEPLTGRIQHEIALPEMDRFQFVDDRTLVGFNSQSEFQVVDLKLRTSQRCSFAATKEVPVPVESPEIPEQPNGPPDDPLWNVSRLQLAFDSLNFYVSNRIGNRAAPQRTPAERQLTVFRGSLRAVDRQSGTLKWALSNDGVLMATTDQPELPVLVLISETESGALGGQSAGHCQFQGISKSTGRQVFDQSIPLINGLRNLSLTSPAPETLDVAVQGLKLRLQGESATP